MPDILVLNGPNLNLLGSREPQHYGQQTLVDIISSLTIQAKAHDFILDALQSNAEHILIERIHQASEEKVRFILFNPAAFTHTSVALRDALLGVAIPFIEVHLSNIHQRETFRHQSYFSDIAEGVIVGLGPKGYQLALETAIERLQADN
jgi:3-dehydroquinate dehydratase-2